MFKIGDLVQCNGKIYRFIERKDSRCLLCDPHNYERLTWRDNLISIIEEVSPYTLGFINIYGDDCRLFGVSVKLTFIEAVEEVPLLKKVLYE